MLELTAFETRTSRVSVRMRSLTLGAWLNDQEGISVAISSLTARADDNELAKREKEANTIFRTFCRQNEWDFMPFIDHNNITADQHLFRSRLHLNKIGALF